MCLLYPYPAYPISNILVNFPLCVHHIFRLSYLSIDLINCPYVSAIFLQLSHRQPCAIFFCLMCPPNGTFLSSSFILYVYRLCPHVLFRSTVPVLLSCVNLCAHVLRLVCATVLVPPLDTRFQQHCPTLSTNQSKTTPQKWTTSPTPSRKPAPR